MFLLYLGRDKAYLRPALPFQILKAAFVTAFQLFVNQYTGGASVAILLRRLDTRSGQSEDFTDSHRAAQSQEQCQTGDRVVTESYRPLCLIGSPDDEGRLFIFWEGSVLSRIDLYVSTSNCLIESATQESMEFFNHLGGDCLGDILVAF